MTGVGFIGLGQIGAPMARQWLDWPDGLTVFDLSAAAIEPFSAAGARTATSPAGVADQSTVISVMVRDDRQVRDVVVGAGGILSTAAPGTVIVIHSTVESGTPRRVGRRSAATRGPRHRRSGERRCDGGPRRNARPDGGRER